MPVGDTTEAAAALIAEARRTASTTPGLPDRMAPRSAADAEAIQRATFATLGFGIGGWKVGRTGPVMVAAPLPREAITEEGDGVVHVPAGTRVELELALRLREPVPVERLDLDALPGVADLVLLIEFVRTRYAPGHVASDLEKVADCVSNEHAVVSPATGPWAPADLLRPEAWLRIDGQEIGRCDASHPAVPLAPLIAGLRERCAADGHRVAAGEIVTLGSLTGIAPLPPAGGMLVGTVAGRGEIRCQVAVDALHVKKEI